MQKSRKLEKGVFFQTEMTAKEFSVQN